MARKTRPSCSLFADFVNGTNVWMIERRGRLCLALESFACVAVPRHIFRKKFQGDEAVQPDVLGFVDHTHAATADFLNDAVV
jgi:hypothetical protein